METEQANFEVLLTCETSPYRCIDHRRQTHQKNPEIRSNCFVGYAAHPFFVFLLIAQTVATEPMAIQLATELKNRLFRIDDRRCAKHVENQVMQASVQENCEVENSEPKAAS